MWAIFFLIREVVLVFKRGGSSRRKKSTRGPLVESFLGVSFLGAPFLGAPFRDFLLGISF